MDSLSVDNVQPCSIGKEENGQTHLTWTNVSNYIDRKTQLSDLDKLNLLENAFLPDSNFKFSYSTRLSKGVEEKRYLKEDHFKRCPYSTYSVKKEGLFGPYSGGHKS